MANILITGAGAPGIWGTCQSLKGHRLIGTDIRADVVGKFFCDKVYLVPRPGKEFVGKIKEIIKKEKIDCIVPQVTAELKWLGQIPIALVNTPQKIDILNNKYKLMKASEKFGCTAKFFMSDGFVAKPPIGHGQEKVKGTRGIENILIVKDKALIMEFLPGKEYSVDCLANKGKMVVCVPRSRDKIRDGITFEGTTVNNQKIIEACRQIIEKLNLDQIIGFQFMEDKFGEPKLIECNPRVQGTMYHATLAGANIIEGAVKQFLTGQSGLSQDKIKWGYKLKRYWGALGEVDVK